VVSGLLAQIGKKFNLNTHRRMSNLVGEKETKNPEDLFEACYVVALHRMYVVSNKVCMRMYVFACVCVCAREKESESLE